MRGLRQSNNFAKSEEGLRIAYLDVNGYKLAPTQGELTPLQREFLLEALPEINRLMMGDNEVEHNKGLPGTKPGNSKSGNADLKTMKAMYNARKKRR